MLFLPGIYNDTLRLLLEAHEYFHLYGQDDQQRLTNVQRLVYSCEMSRITMRLSSIMAWLMVRKAVFSGKIPMEDAIHRYPLDGREVSLHRNEEAESMLPSYINYLLEESFHLYSRVSRLDEMIRLGKKHH